MAKVPLADWLSSIRAELAQASEQYKKKGSPEPGLILQDLTLEVEVSTEQSDSTEIGWQLWVLAGKIGAMKMTQQRRS